MSREVGDSMPIPEKACAFPAPSPPVPVFAGPVVPGAPPINSRRCPQNRHGPIEPYVNMEPFSPAFDVSVVIY
jgi:hypothetical protein